MNTHSLHLKQKQAETTADFFSIRLLLIFVTLLWFLEHYFNNLLNKQYVDVLNNFYKLNLISGISFTLFFYIFITALVFVFAALNRGANSATLTMKLNMKLKKCFCFVFVFVSVFVFVFHSLRFEGDFL